MDRVHFDDLTKINVELGRLDDDTYNRLLAHDGPIECCSRSRSWGLVCAPSWVPNFCYRAKPRPLTKPQVPDELWRALPDWVKGFAKNADGTIVLLSCAARVSASGEWWVAVNSSHLRGWKIDPGTCDWRDSLVKRPEGL